jgi:hypothetical protein
MSSLHQNNGRLSQFLFTDGLPMARWITFDQKTSSILRSTLAQGTRIDTLLRGPIDYALARPSAVIAVLPAGQGDFLGIATFRRARAAVTQRAATEQLRSSLLPPRPAAQHASTRAGGFLGLSDEPVFDDEAPQEKKGWWRKFWDE